MIVGRTDMAFAWVGVLWVAMLRDDGRKGGLVWGIEGWHLAIRVEALNASRESLKLDILELERSAAAAA